MYRLGDPEKRQIHEELKQGRHIPKVLLDQMDGLGHISYRKDLFGFASSYGQHSFSDLDEEYEEVYEFCHGLLDRTQGKQIAGALEISKRLEVMRRLQDPTYRDHFIHSVQDFLLGAVILDQFYDLLKTWYSPKLCKTSTTSVEASWLLTSIFHDRTRALESREWLGEEDGYTITQSFAFADEYLTCLASVYGHLRKGRDLCKWRYKRCKPSDHELRDILHEWYKKQNHGVLSAMTLLKRVKETHNGAVPSHCAAASLAIAMHDTKPRRMLRKRGIFPIRMDRFPISCLLLYCDAIQEWGRPRSDAVESTRLTRIELNPDGVHCEVAFPTPDAARAKIRECDSVRQSIESRQSNLHFSFSPRLLLT